MENKKKLYEVDVRSDKKLAVRLYATTVLLVFPFFWLFGFIASKVELQNVTNEMQFIEALFVLLMLTIIHEWIHGLFFKIFCPKNPVKYGIKWKTGMAYAISPKSLYNRFQTVVIALAPFVLISLGLTASAMFGWIDKGAYQVLATMHAAACIGDFYYTYLLMAKFKKVVVEVAVTEKGLIIYQA
ncbi:TPA: DUF3267 domain-containing protein [Streptococcus suis]|nr:DUF3267 domain-containing protein [Streptococcus suis]HEM5235664.1 DUF3267 domain-containing protein [Streptococcus suis]HEM5241629.1 DUF3267 domain-containing protein [Streptococcus suis]